MQVLTRLPSRLSPLRNLVANSPITGLWRHRLSGVLIRSWTHGGALTGLLWPISLVFRALVLFRRNLFQWGILKVRKTHAIVIVVGNVIAGGAGKTPTVISIVRHLKAQGHCVGIISRGYGRKDITCREVKPHSLPQDVGDEPVLMYRATQVPVFVGRNRYEAAEALLANHPNTNIIVCDDGLQHYGLYRDLEVCVFDDRGCGNGHLLPAGPLRESWPRKPLSQAGQRDDRLLTLHTGNKPAFMGYHATRHLADHAVRNDGSIVPIGGLGAPPNKPIAAVAGIAQPDTFFAMLESLGLALAKTQPLPDHYSFDSITRSTYKGYQVICTEKDAQKLWLNVPDALAVPLVQIAEAGFFDAIDACILAQLQARLLFTYGHKTT